MSKTAIYYKQPRGIFITEKSNFQAEMESEFNFAIKFKMPSIIANLILRHIEKDIDGEKFSPEYMDWFWERSYRKLEHLRTYGKHYDAKLIVTPMVKCTDEFLRTKASEYCAQRNIDVDAQDEESTKNIHDSSSSDVDSDYSDQDSSDYHNNHSSSSSSKESNHSQEDEDLENESPKQGLKRKEDYTPDTPPKTKKLKIEEHANSEKNASRQETNNSLGNETGMVLLEKLLASGLISKNDIISVSNDVSKNNELDSDCANKDNSLKDLELSGDLADGSFSD